MKKSILISIVLFLLLTSCLFMNNETRQTESIVVGNQSVQLTLSTNLAVFDSSTPIILTLEVENQSNLPIFVPWGKSPGFTVVFVSLDSTSRRIFGVEMPTPSADINQYPSVAPREKMTSEVTIPFDLEAGKYNICAEILIIGDSGINNDKPKVCVPISYQD